MQHYLPSSSSGFFFTEEAKSPKPALAGFYIEKGDLLYGRLR